MSKKDDESTGSMMLGFFGTSFVGCATDAHDLAGSGGCGAVGFGTCPDGGPSFPPVLMSIAR